MDFRLQTPTGQIIEPWRALAEPSMRYVLSNGVSYYRLALPVQLQPNRFDQAGTWHALLTIGRPRLERSSGSPTGVDRTILRRRPGGLLNRPASLRRQLEAQHAAQFATPAATHLAAPIAAASDGRTPTLPYSLIVHAYSQLAFGATAEQTSYEVGARVRLSATVAQSGLPAPGAVVWADVTRPDGSGGTLSLIEGPPGEFRGDYDTTMAGVFRFRLRARGRTRKGVSYSRERTVTAAVWRGGDRDAENGANPGGSIGDVIREQDARWCALLHCLLREGGAITPELEQRLRSAGLNVEQWRKCLEIYCKSLHQPNPGGGTGPARDDV